jgi:hypothetical protein
MQRLFNYFVTIFSLLVMCTITQAAEQKASGTYVYNTTAKTLELTFESSTFVCDGPPEDEVVSVTDVSITESSLIWTELWEGEPDPKTWTRVTGTGDSLIGKWQRGTKSIEFLNATQFETIGADSSECPEGTGTHNASGTYTYNPVSSNSNLIFEVTTSDFTCSGPTLGSDTFTVSAITATAMTWTWEDGSQMLLTRDSGDPGNIHGTWQSEDSGNSFTFTIDATTISVVGQISNCDDGDQQDGAFISTNHQLDSYWVDINVVDSQGTITAVTVAGPGISEPVSLTAIDNSTRWVSWIVRDPAFNFNNGIPDLPLTYTLTITRDGQDTVETLTATSFLLEFAHPVVPAENEPIETLQTFTWTGPGETYNYSVQLFNNNSQPIWERYNIYGVSVDYDGPVLEPGSYFYTLQTNGNDNNNSMVLVPFTILLKGDLDGDGDIDLGDVITGLKAVAGNTSENISTGGDVNGDKKIGVEEAIYSMQATGELTN